MCVPGFLPVFDDVPKLLGLSPIDLDQMLGIFLLYSVFHANARATHITYHHFVAFKRGHYLLSRLKRVSFCSSVVCDAPLSSSSSGAHHSALADAGAVVQPPGLFTGGSVRGTVSTFSETEIVFSSRCVIFRFGFQSPRHDRVLASFELLFDTLLDLVSPVFLNFWHLLRTFLKVPHTDLPLSGTVTAAATLCPISGTPPFTQLAVGIPEWAGHLGHRLTSTGFIPNSWIPPISFDICKGGVRRMRSSSHAFNSISLLDVCTCCEPKFLWHSFEFEVSSSPFLPDCSSFSRPCTLD